MKQLGYILEAMDEIYDDRGDISAKAKGLYTTFSDGTSVFAVLMAVSVFEPLEELCIALQSTNKTESGMMSAVNKVIDFLENCRSEESFAALFTNATNVITKLELKEIRVPREQKYLVAKIVAAKHTEHHLLKIISVRNISKSLTWLFSSYEIDSTNLVLLST